jgi:hypothetical protein
MRRLGVVIRATADRQAVPVGHCEVSLRIVGSVLAVVRLERVETGLHERWNQLVASEQSGMRERRDAAGRVDSREHFRRGWTDSRHKRTLPCGKKPIERFLRVGDVSACDQGSRNPGPAGGFRRVVSARLQHGVCVQDDAERLQAIDHLANALDAPLPL